MTDPAPAGDREDSPASSDADDTRVLIPDATAETQEVSPDTVVLDAPPGAEPTTVIPAAVDATDDPAAPWSRAVRYCLLGAGLVLAVVTFIIVMRIGDLPYHPNRDAELRAAYDTYRETGVLMVKHNGTGNPVGQVPGDGITRAGGDEDPATYIAALLMSHITHSDSPYPGLRVVMALLCSLPLLLLPLAIARLFRNRWAGFSMLALPLVMWLVNRGTLLAGTEYGQSDSISETRVYALYGITGSMAFLSLVVILYLLTKRFRLRGLIGASVLLVVLASLGNLTRSMSGVAIGLAAGVIWWINRTGRWRRLGEAVGVSVLCALLSFALPSAVARAIDAQRADILQNEATAMTSTHGLWHPLYLGLSYPQPITGEPSRFSIIWSDEFGWDRAREVDPTVRIASPEFQSILKDYYLDIVREHPLAVARLYVEKFIYTVRHYGLMFLLAIVGFGIAFIRPGPQRRALGGVLVAVAPMVLFGLMPAVLVMPMLYYFSELTASLAILVAVALGSIGWAIAEQVARRRNATSGSSAPSDPTAELGAGGAAL